MRILHRFAPALVCVMVVLGSSGASATSVVLLTQDRSISASASGCFNAEICGSDSQSDAAVSFDVFDSTVSAGAPTGSALASQLSTLTSSLLSASVHTTGFGSEGSFGFFGSGHASSIFRVAFSATEAVPYVIQGSHLAGSLSQIGEGLVTIALRDSSGGVLWQTHGGGSDFAALTEFAHSGILAPGAYLLEASASSSGTPALAFNSSGRGIADFNFELQIVPEPTTATTLGLALVLLGLRSGRGRERRRRDARLARSSP